MKNRRNILRHAKFIICCAVFACICLFGSAAAFAVNDEGALLDREGRQLEAENFIYYDAASDCFAEYLENGDKVYLTIELDLQDAVSALIEEEAGKWDVDASGLCAVVLDVNTGAPLVLAGQGIEPLNTLFSPGRLFLPCTALAAMNSCIVEPDTLIQCQGVFSRYEQDGLAPECWIWNAVPEQNLTHSEENVTTALRDACLYYFYTLGNDLGIDALEEYARSLGFGEESGIELPAEKGIIASRTLKNQNSPWNIGDTLEASVGGSFSRSSPLQLASYCAAIANGGKSFSTSLVYEIADCNGDKIASRETRLLREAARMEQENWNAVRDGLFLMSDDKDKSAEMPQRELMAGMSSKNSDDKGNTEQLFMGYAPFSEPEIAIVVGAKNPDESSFSVSELAYKILELYTKTR